MTTLAQGNQVLNLILQHHIPNHQMQKLLASGLLADLLDANVDIVDRDNFRDLLGLCPLKEKQRPRDGHALQRYPWLQKKFHFTSMDLHIIDEDRGATFIGRRAVTELHVKRLTANPGNFQELIIQEMEKSKDDHCIPDAAILDKYGNDIGGITYTDGWSLDWDFDFQDVRFVVVSKWISPSAVTLYEIKKI